MMKNLDQELLAEQLLAALAALEQGQGQPFEVAVLAGLLARYAPSHKALAQAVALRDAGEIAAPDERQVEEAVERLHELDREDPAEERYDALADLDELCAGAWFSGQPDRVMDAADQVARLFAGFAADWQDLAALASAVLEQAPPHPADPARRMWRALEATRWQSGEPQAAAPRCEDAQRRLGILPRVALSSLAEGLPAQAAGDLPPASQVCPLCDGPGFALALVVDAAEGRGLVLRCSGGASVRLLREGEEVALTRLRPGLFRAPARPGVYQVMVDGEEAFAEVVT